MHESVQRGFSPEDAICATTTFSIDVFGEGRDLRGVIATLDAIQLAIDAAAVAVLYDRDVAGHSEVGAFDPFLRSLAARPPVSLEIVELQAGSFGARVIAVFKEPVPRRIALSIGALGAAVIAIIVPPVGVPLTVVAAGLGAGGEIADAVQGHRDARRRAEVIEDLQSQVHAGRERERELQRQIASLDARVTALHERMVDTEAVREAQPTKVVFDQRPIRA